MTSACSSASRLVARTEAMMETGQRRLLRWGRAIGWIGVALTGAAVLGSIFVVVDRLRSATLSLALVVVLAWVAMVVLPLVVVGSVTASRLRFLTAPSLVAPGLMLAAAAVVLAPVQGLLLLVPAGVMLVSTGLLRTWREVRIVEASGREGVRPRL